MLTVIATGGKSSRAAALTGGGPKALFPIEGLPLVGHLINRIAEAAPLGSVTLIGAPDNPHGRMVYDYVTGLLAPRGHTVRLIEQVPGGAGAAFYSAARHALAVGAEALLFTVCDTIACSYKALLAPPVAIGVSPPPQGSAKQYTLQSIRADGTLGPPDPAAPATLRALNGVYKVDRAALIPLVEAMAAALGGRAIHPQQFNNKGELRVSWVWEVLAQQGFIAQAADMGPFAELNGPDDLEWMRTFLRAEPCQ